MWFQNICGFNIYVVSKYMWFQYICGFNIFVVSKSVNLSWKRSDCQTLSGVSQARVQQIHHIDSALKKIFQAQKIHQSHTWSFVPPKAQKKKMNVFPPWPAGAF